MKLSWRDLFTTIIAAAVVVILVAKLRSYDWTFLDSWKSAVGVLGVFGGLMAIFDESDFTRLNTWSAIEGILVLAGIGLVIAGLLVASKALFVILAAVILAFWLTSVTRHEISPEAPVTHAVM